MILVGSRRLAAVGDPDALAPARQQLLLRREGLVATVVTSALSPARLGAETRSSGASLLIRRQGHTLLSTLPPHARADMQGTDIPIRGARRLGGREYRIASFTAPSFDPAPVKVAVFADRDALAGRTGRARAIAIAALVGFIAVALAFAFAVSRGLQRQIARFLAAARRLGSGDFSTPVPTEGNDEFAQLGHEFNAMAGQLEERIEELGRQAGVSRSRSGGSARPSPPTSTATRCSS